MNTTRAIEYRITRELLRRRAGQKTKLPVERIITTVSIVAVLAMLGAVMPALLWIVLLGAVVLTLGG